MNCPKCYGKTTVRDCVNTSEENYRKRACASCGHIFFTIEFEAEDNENFKKVWGRNYRKHKKGVE